MLTFLGIGAQKCGTTWLYFNLRPHPEVYLPPEVKELHFWDRHRDKGLDWYRTHFAANTDNRPAGEITPAYAILEPSVIHDVRATCPDIKIFYMIRNPVRRAWSSALMALERAEMTLDDASDAWFIDHFHSVGSSQRSDYETCLRHWEEVFPRDRIHVELFDDILSDPRGVLKRCARHIGVDPAFFDTVPDETLSEPHFPGPGDIIRPSLHAHLVAHFTPRIRALEAYLDRDLSVWHRDNGLLPALPPASSKGFRRGTPRQGLLAWLRRAVAANDPGSPSSPTDHPSGS